MGLILAFFLLGLFTYTEADWWSDQKKKIEGGAAKFEKDTRQELARAAEEAKRAALKAREDLIAEINRSNKNLQSQLLKARSDAIQDLTQMPQNVSRQAEARVRDAIAAPLNQLRNSAQAQQAIFVEKLKNAVLKVVPGYEMARWGFIAKNVALAGDKLRLINTNVEQLVANANGWPSNKKALPPSCNAIKTNLKAMFDPFLVGNEAAVMNISASVRRLSTPLQNAVADICRGVDDIQNLANQGKEIQQLNVNTLQQMLRDQLAREVRQTIERAIIQIPVAAISPF